MRRLRRSSAGIACALAFVDGVPSTVVGTRLTGKMPVLRGEGGSSRPLRMGRDELGELGGGSDQEVVQAFGEGGWVFDFAAFGDDGLGVEEVGEGFDAVVGGGFFEEGV